MIENLFFFKGVRKLLLWQWCVLCLQPVGPQSMGLQRVGQD